MDLARNLKIDSVSRLNPTPAEDANGFYQCTEPPAPSCDLLIQLRSGVHVEIRGSGTTSRADVDAIARALPLRALSR